MKLFKYLLATVCFAVLLSGCSCNLTPQEIYFIGEEYAFETVTVKVEDDEAEQRYVLYYTVTKEDGNDHSFTFNFTYNTCETIRNSDEFKYYTSDPDEEITFNENGYYYFYGSRTFYITYKNASEEIKNSIENKTCNISFSFGTFIYNN